MFPECWPENSVSTSDCSTVGRVFVVIRFGTPPGPVHDLFLFLANEETKHKNELEAIYYEIVHSGGV